MSWRVVNITKRAKLDYKMNYLVVRTGEETVRIHISEIAVLLIESTAVSLTVYLLNELAKNKVNVIFCDGARCPLGSFLPFYGSHDTSLKVREQVAWRQESKDAVWAALIHTKISGQIAVLEQFAPSACALLESYLPQIEPGDATNREGHAAKVYFNALFGKDFSRSGDCPVNAALNYGYSILLSAVAREITVCGYITQLGIFHNNRFNDYNLASDLMEVFRPFVDVTVCNMRPERLEREEKMVLINILNTEIFIDRHRQTVMNAIKIYLNSVFSALRENDVTLLKTPAYELQIYENDRLF